MIRVNSVLQHVPKKCAVTDYVILNVHITLVVIGIAGTERKMIFQIVIPNAPIMKILLDFARSNVVPVTQRSAHHSAHQTAIKT